MSESMTTKELGEYLRLHQITVCKYAAEGKIPGIRVGRVWRFDKVEIDNWIRGLHPKRNNAKKATSHPSKSG